MKKYLYIAIVIIFSFFGYIVGYADGLSAIKYPNNKTDYYGGVAVGDICSAYRDCKGICLYPSFDDCVKKHEPR
jgi:hypothetical protein